MVCRATLTMLSYFLEKSMEFATFLSVTIFKLIQFMILSTLKWSFWIQFYIVSCIMLHIIKSCIKLCNFILFHYICNSFRENSKWTATSYFHHFLIIQRPWRCDALCDINFRSLLWFDNFVNQNRNFLLYVHYI